MLFNSLGFLVFLASVLLLYYSPIPWNSKKGMLLAASYLFYSLWSPPLVILLWISTIVDWTAGKKLFVEERPGRRKLWLLLSVGTNLGLLGYFKYGGFLMENFTVLMNGLGFAYEAPPFDIILPMGISFYTFQTMSYTIDAYHRKNEPARTFLDFALYVTFFPQLVAGPIVRSKDLLSQFYEPKRANAQQFLWGLALLTLGLFEKIVLADTLLSGVSDRVFGAADKLASLDAWAGVLAFSGQIFFDFAGYSTCAIGIALTLGFVLPDNFRYPYAAIGFSDLWRRWHITLSTWLRDYLYVPLGGNRKGISRTYVNLLIVMLLGGLWHGAAWTFVAWGMLHGLFLAGERFVRGRFELRLTPVTGLLLALGTYFWVNVTWVFFRAEDFDDAARLLSAMFVLGETGKAILPTFDVVKVLAVVGLLFAIHWMMRNTSVAAATRRLPWWAFGLAWSGMLLSIIIAQGSQSQFIYFQF